MEWALRPNRVNNIWRRMTAAKTTVDARYILVEEMESMKVSNRFTNMFWADSLVEDIRIHWFTLGKNFQKEQLWKGLSLLLCGMMYASDQTSFRNEEEDQTKATPTMYYKTLKSIQAGNQFFSHYTTTTHSRVSSLRMLFWWKFCGQRKIGMYAGCGIF